MQIERGRPSALLSYRSRTLLATSPAPPMSISTINRNAPIDKAPASPKQMFVPLRSALRTINKTGAKPAMPSKGFVPLAYAPSRSSVPPLTSTLPPPPAWSRTR